MCQSNLMCVIALVKTEVSEGSDCVRIWRKV